MSQASARGRRIGLASFAMLAMTMLAITGSAARAATPIAPTVAAPTDATSLDPVIQWNRVLLGILNTPGAQPATIHATRNLAILHAAIYDAVDSIAREVRPVRRLDHLTTSRRPVAAASAAGYTVLSSLYPGQQETVAAQFASLLAQVPNGYHKYEGVRIGEATANALLALRADDGSSNAQPVFVPGAQPGDYQPTPPAFAQPAFTQWPTVRPFAFVARASSAPHRRRA